MVKRALENLAFQELREKIFVPRPMVFLTGARQVGKTWLTTQLTGAAYFNWDTVEVKKSYVKEPYFFRSEHKMVVFDEIHKRKDWKKILKGYYDSSTRQENFIVTGSGRFDQYQRGGDSLQGRYNSFKLWPFSFDETSSLGSNILAAPRDWQHWEPDSSSKISDEDLIQLGGFPIPFLGASEQKARRWQDQYLDRLIREDVRDFSLVQRLDKMEMLARLLPERVGSPLSLQALSEDIEVSPVAVRTWLRLFETLFLGLRIYPFHRKIHRAVKKEAKWYFEQWSFCEDKGACFENYMAIQLALACSAWSEQGYGRYELCFLRDQDRREVDFVITRNLRPLALIECKSSPQSWPVGLRYYAQKLKVPAFLLYPSGPVIREKEALGWSSNSASFLQGLLVERKI
ncbi:MAG: ATP-binding protein [Deltaproteobacteria bacterium]|nr:ATP-binding protein [Deltaproteobacteria bacterium]